LRNDITRLTPASFEPTIDYVVTKIRVHVRKIPGRDATLTSAMKSVGEAMAIGRTFKESMQKAFALARKSVPAASAAAANSAATSCPRTRSSSKSSARPNADRIFYIRYAFLAGYSVEKFSISRRSIRGFAPAQRDF